VPLTEATWQRVSPATCCPICGKADWCSIAADEAVCICMRVESNKRTKNGGFLHRLTDGPRPCAPRRIVFPTRTSLPDLTALATSYRETPTADRLTALAAELGVTVSSLTAFRVGWAASYPAWSFPLREPATGKVTGIRLRPLIGKKFSVTGGKESLFMPDVLIEDEVLLVTEGATDAIAAHTIGFANAVGRPSCTGGTAHVVALVRLHKPARVVIVADNDEPGVRGADALASVLALHNRDVRVIAPPDGVKDVRAWTAAGATRHDLERLISAAGQRRLNLTLTTKESK
jgi:hypothetical protein